MLIAIYHPQTMTTQFSVRYHGNKNGSSETPYNDWVNYGRPNDTIIMFYDDAQPNVELNIVYVPHERFMYVYYDNDCFTCIACGILDIDDETKTARVSRMLTSRVQYVIGHRPMTTKGTINLLRSCSNYACYDFIDILRDKILGPQWKIDVCRRRANRVKGMDSSFFEVGLDYMNSMIHGHIPRDVTIARYTMR